MGFDVDRLPLLIRRPPALVLAAVAALDVVYRMLVRAPLRRSLGIEPPPSRPSQGRRRSPARVPPRPRREE
jgi:hypothetical protein